MKSRSKTFARKLVALFLAVIMAVSCFTSVVTAFAKSTDDYHDNSLAANFMTWAETTDNQTAEALLDWADMHLDDLILSLGVKGNVLNGDHLNVNISVGVTISIEGYLDSIDGVLDLIPKAQAILDKYAGLIGGDVNNIDLSAVSQLNAPSTKAEDVISRSGVSYRATNDAKDIILAIAKLLAYNSNDDYRTGNVIGQFVKGNLSLGLLNNLVDLYGLLKNPLGLWDGYQSNLVYNIISNLILTKSGWYTESEIAAYQSDIQAGNGNWVLDDQLMDKLSKKLMQQINAEITYPALGPSGTGTESSKVRYKKITDKMAAEGLTMAQASEALGYDPNLKYTSDGNVYLFCYGDQKLTIAKDAKLLQLGYEVLQLAWKTCLKDTLSTLRVNYGHNDNKNYGSNYDNAFYYWMRNNNRNWSSTDMASNYSAANVNAWAEDVYAEYGAVDAADFLADVQDNLTLDRTTVKDATGSWKDIDSTKLFLKLRYSPLADYHFDMQTGPLNLYLMQTGFANLEAFFANDYSNYSDLAALFNDALLCAAKDLFPDSKNIGMTVNGTYQSLARPTMNKAGVSSFSSNTSSNIDKMATTLIGNVVKMFEYAANATDENILNGFYIKHSVADRTTSSNLSEATFEEAMVPFLISCIQNVTATEQIHDEKWDACQDAEGVAYVALEEYLSYVLPDKDYSSLVKLDSNGKYVAGTVDINGDSKYTIFDDAILPMVRDALGFILQSIVPCRTKSGEKWNVYTTDPIKDKTTVFDILNSIVCYYASTDSFSDGGFNSTSATGKSAAAILGVVDSNGNCLVKSSNTLWQNIDAIANSLLPVLGTLQYGDIAHAAQFNSYELFYNKIIKGVLDIGPNSGVTNIVKQLLTIFTAEPIRNKGLVELVYDDVVASLLNNLFGARYARQTYKQIIPYTSNYTSSSVFTNANPLDKMTAEQSKAPFNALVDRNILALYDYTTDKQTGVLGILIENIYEFFAYSDSNSNFRAGNTTQVGAKGCWEGAMFLVKAVNNFIPSFVPQLGEHTFKPATVKFAITSATAVEGGAPMTGNTLKFTNQSTGLNRFYKNSDNKTISQDPRYYAVIKNVVCKAGNSNPSNITIDKASTIGQVVGPEESVNIAISGTYPRETQNLSVTVTYDIFESASDTSTAPANAGDYLYTNLTTTGYMYLSPDKGWSDKLFDQTDASGIKGTSSRTGYVTNSVGGSTTAEYYNNFLIQDNNASVINDYGLMVKGSGYDTMFSYPTAGTKYSYVDGVDADGKYVLGKTMTASGTDKGLAYATVNSETGDLLNTSKQDFKWDSDANWNRGTNNAGFDEDGIQAIIDTKAKYDTEGNMISCPGYQVRTHIAYTPKEAFDEGAIEGVIMNGNSIEAAIVYSDYIGDITPGTEVNGISLMGDAVTTTAEGQYKKWIQCTNTSKVFTPQEFDLQLATRTGSTISMTGKTHVIIYNNSGATTLQNKYNSYLAEMSPYDKSDFDDLVGEGTTSYSPVLNTLNTAFSNTVVALGSVVTEANAAGFSSITETVPVTHSTTSTTGDLAYVPLSADKALPAGLTGYVKGGYYYADEDCTMPIYSNVELTAADVTNGKDAAGTAVKEVNGKYYIVNAPQYETEWIIIADGDVEFPYRNTTSVQAKTDAAVPELLYEQANYNFFRANGEQTGDVNWTVKVPQMMEAIKKYDGTTDYRGTYQKYSDMLDYRVEIAKGHVNTDVANIIGKEVSEARSGLVNVDYIVDTYEKKVSVAKEAESLITSTPVYKTDADGNYVNDLGEIVDEANKVWDHNTYSTTSPAVAIREAKRIYDRFDERVISRGYIGDKLEAEIKCATGYTYNNFTVTGGDVYYTSGAEAKYGAYDASGKLYNPTVDGELQYSETSWNNYVTALAEAITAAEAKNCKISEAFNYKKNLMIAENNLEAPSARTEITVSGKITVAADAAGTGSQYGISGVRVKIGNKTYAVTEKNGAFTAVLPIGTTTFTVTGNNTIDRTITINGQNDIKDVNIGIVNTDYNADGAVNAVDAFLYSETGKVADADRNLNGDASVDEQDGAILNMIIKNGVAYDNASLD